MSRNAPPLGLPKGAGTKVRAGGWEERKFPPGISDGSQSKWPSHPYRRSDERNYLTKLAQAWAERDGTARPSTNYYLDRLPDGYGLFEMDQPSGPQTYKRLFGHPSGQYYDSIQRFQTHFFWILDGKKGLCFCVKCGNYKPEPGPPRPRKSLGLDASERAVLTPRTTLRQDRALPTRSLPGVSEDDRSSRSASAGGMVTDRSRRTARQVQTAYPVDEEGTRNVWKEAIALTFRSQDSRHGIEDDIREEDSIDWLSERESMPQYLTQIEQQHSFVPRLGELVLWIPNFPEGQFLLRDPTTNEYCLYDAKEKKFLGFPRWRAGVIAAVPSAASKNGTVDFPDVLDVPEKKTSLNTAGFRVETMVDPNNDDDKSMSKQYKYVPMRSIRPLSHWQLVLKGIPQKDLHPSILYALTCMTSVSLVEKWRYNGDWKAGGYISAKGVYLGSELITIGDTIRLLPETGVACTDVIVVDSIRLRMAGFKAEHQEHDTPAICSSHAVTFLGQAFTTDIKSAYTIEDPNTSSQVRVPTEIRREDAKYTFRPVGTAEYGSWWLMHAANQKYEVSYDQVLGRLYEADVIRLWSGQREYKYKPGESPAAMKPDLSFDITGIIAGRKYATKADERIPELPPDEPDGIRWLVSDSRAQALTLASVNGLETAAYHDIRTMHTLTSWRAHIKISNGEKVTATEMLSTTGTRAPPKPRYYFGDDPTMKSYEGKRRGRPAGSKVVDGKLYTADMLANMTDVPTGTNTPQTGDEVEVEDLAEEGLYDDDGIEIAETQTPHKHSSQMAGAALDSTDEEDLMAEDEESDDQATPRRPLKSRLAAYGGEDEDVDVNDLDDEMEDLSVENWQKTARAQPSKSQIMQSVERGQASTLANAQNYEMSGDDTDDDEWDTQNIEAWKNPRNARGGTEESSGGDYRED
ncbi:hypothetical protein OHC33_010550 [Knufia fluminis]|uniref:Cryptic loci regulator 2 N-terminal domain-containing protein n=1 Tax=Knufia fluminis TaxID=191047 RepID=A0AAN8EJB3_9EURO|nr:hypothetical protein OHC33_010550 [Knufia fluminis]